MYCPIDAFCLSTQCAVRCGRIQEKLPGGIRLVHTVRSDAGTRIMPPGCRGIDRYYQVQHYSQAPAEASVLRC